MGEESQSRVLTPLVDYRSMAFKVCKEYLQGTWRSIREDEFFIKRISGGLSNHIFYCSLPPSKAPRGHEPAAVLLRLYGESDENVNRYFLTHMINNVVVFTMLSERGLGPKLYGVFPEGRLEEYIPSRSMHPSEVRDSVYSAVIARKLAKIHGLSTPINKETQWLSKMFKGYLSQVNSLSIDEVSGRDQDIAKDLLEFDFSSEIDWLMRFVSAVHSPIVFCHNDVQGGNVLLRQEASSADEKIMLIDYEFCGYNFRGHDLANHFSEWEYDYTRKDFPFYNCHRENFPSKERQIEFFIAYLSTMDDSSSPEPLPTQTHGDQKRTRSASGHGQGGASASLRNSANKRRRNHSVSAASDSSLRIRAEQLYREVRAFTLVPSLMWCMWAMVHSTNTKIPFGYWHYARDRMTDYNNHKKRVLSQLEQEKLQLIGESKDRVIAATDN